MGNRELVVALVEEVRQDFADLKNVHGGLPSLAKALDRICTRIQKGQLTKELAGAEKRELAIDAALLAIQRFVPPRWLGWLPESVQRWVLGMMVDQVVAFFKKKGWPALEAA